MKNLKPDDLCLAVGGNFFTDSLIANEYADSFVWALDILGIPEYGERIFNSNSHGELFHIMDYISLAKFLKESNDCEWFRPWFISVVEEAEKTWKRPESVFQHLHPILMDCLNSKEGLTS